MLGGVGPEVGTQDQLTLVGALADAARTAQLGHQLVHLGGCDQRRHLGTEPGCHRPAVARREVGDDLPPERPHLSPGGVVLGPGAAAAFIVA